MERLRDVSGGNRPRATELLPPSTLRSPLPPQSPLRRNRIRLFDHSKKCVAPLTSELFGNLQLGRMRLCGQCVGQDPDPSTITAFHA